MDEKALTARLRAVLIASSDPREVRIAATAFGLAAVRGYPALLEDMVTLSRRRTRDSSNLLRLQFCMMNEILALEASTREHKRAIQEQDDKHRLSEEELFSHETEIYFNRLITKAIRTVGDGIVWRLLGRDRGAYYALAQGHGPAPVGTAGLPAELKRLAHIVAQEEGIALLSSLTNCVRFGDLVVFKETDGNERNLMIEEVKSGDDRTPRFTRQRRRVNELLSLLEEREGRIGTREVTINVRDTPQEFYLQAVLNIIQEARKRGAAAKTFDNYLRVESFCLSPTSADLDLDAWPNESRLAMEPWSRAGDTVMDACNLELKAMTPNHAPYSVFPYPDQIRGELLTNQVGLRSYLNVSEVLRRISNAGWQVESDLRTEMLEFIKEGNDPREAAFVRLKRGRRTIALPPSVGTRLLFEYLKPRSLIRELEFIDRNASNVELEASLSYYPSEALVWD